MKKCVEVFLIVIGVLLVFPKTAICQVSGTKEITDLTLLKFKISEVNGDLKIINTLMRESTKELKTNEKYLEITIDATPPFYPCVLDTGGLVFFTTYVNESGKVKKLKSVKSSFTCTECNMSSDDKTSKLLGEFKKPFVIRKIFISPQEINSFKVYFFDAIQKRDNLIGQAEINESQKKKP